MGFKPSRLPVEREVGPGYMERLEEAGPRTGESELSWRVRMGGLYTGRSLLLQKIEKLGAVIAAFEELGVTSKNVVIWVRRLGFTLDELQSLPTVRRELPPVRLPEDPI